MGVPAFYRWLSEKYPKIIEDVLEQRVQTSSGSNRLPFDWSGPNPSGLECDNLYIDMNGIIHPCSHPEHGPQPTCEEEMFENVCRYVDRLVRVMRPRQMLYLAIDGVAPRAKMNQQRARRFRSAQEARENRELEENVRQELLKGGQKIPPTKKAWDSNVITPGTSFMVRLSEFLRFYVRKRLTEDESWQHLRVIYSDASIPGEGEHKIMSHIRLQRSQAGYDPNLVHILHGLDADLIMLALATHETYFYISRELVLFGRKSQEQLEQRQLESGFKDAQRIMDEEAGIEAMELEENQGKPLQRVSIPILREYLANEFAECLQPGRLPFPVSLERLIDDVVFMCFFVGNDFLPHLPSLDIRDGALDYLFNVYKRVLPTMGGFITNHGGAVDLSKVDIMLAEVGAIEDHVFAMKYQNEMRQKERQRQHRERVKLGGDADNPRFAKQSQSRVLGRAAKILANKERHSSAHALQRGHAAKEDKRKSLKSSEENAKAAELLKKSLNLESKGVIKKENVKVDCEDEKDVTSAGQKRNREDQAREVVPSNKEKTKRIQTDGAKNTIDNDEEVEFEPHIEVDDEDDDNGDNQPLVAPEIEEVDPEAAAAFKAKVKEQKQKQLDDYTNNVQDNVRLHETGWKDRYYSDKCKADDVTAHGGREHLFRSYVVGLCWVMKYYYDGCPSWKWYYPFHYAPFASDLRNIERFENDVKALELNEPFSPIEQLMAVLPEDSSHAIPKPSRWLMSDHESPIIDFYPKDVPVDPNGKAMPWLWVVLLPFIDEERLLDALRPSQKEWTSIENLANARGLDDGYLYVHKSHGLMKKTADIYNDIDKYKISKVRITGAASLGVKGITGSVRLPLSNEAHRLTDDKRIDLPATAQKINRPSHDNLFADDIETSSVLCVAFTEPAKLSHKSVMLPGAKPPKPCLKPEDKVIRRPKLNRGGGTIANMGGGGNTGKSYQAGYGSMNISQYERDLAARSGRGQQMYQTGTRAWGAAEPTPKRQRGQGTNNPGFHQQQPRFHSNPFTRPPQQVHQNGGNGPPWQQNQQQFSQHGQVNYSQQNGHSSTQQRQQQANNQDKGYTQSHRQLNNHQGYNQRQQYNIQQGYNQQGYSQGQSQGNPQHRQGHNRPYSVKPQHARQGQQNFSFQNYNRSAPAGPPQQSRVNSSVMNNLRSQLASTLQQHRKGKR